MNAFTCFTINEPTEATAPPSPQETCPGAPATHISFSSQLLQTFLVWAGVPEGSGACTLPIYALNTKQRAGQGWREANPDNSSSTV